MLCRLLLLRLGPCNLAHELIVKFVPLEANDLVDSVAFLKAAPLESLLRLKLHILVFLGHFVLGACSLLKVVVEFSHCVFLLQQIFNRFPGIDSILPTDKVLKRSLRTSSIWPTVVCAALLFFPVDVPAFGEDFAEDGDFPLVCGL